MTETPTPVVFIHGLWLHHTSWGPWQDLFTEHGYAPVAPPWPGEEATVAATRANPDPMAGYGVVEVADHYADVIAALPSKPIVIGHSFGGLIAQILLGRGPRRRGRRDRPGADEGRARAAGLGAAGRLDRAAQPGQLRQDGRAEPGRVHLRLRQQPDPGRVPPSCTRSGPCRPPASPCSRPRLANFELHAATTVDLHNSHRGPLLITLGGKDHTVPPAISKATYKLHHKKSSAVTDLQEFPEADHSLTIDSDWRQVADAVLAWLKKQGR